MTGPELLEHAAGVVTRRRCEYGEPVDVFEAIAKRWSSVFGMRVSAAIGDALLDQPLASWRAAITQAADQLLAAQHHGRDPQEHGA